MKKRKISFLLNICTICLAVVAIVIGVYSLQQAKLTVNGSLGFVAHNVNARVDAYMYGYSVSTNGAPITAEQKVRLTPQNGLLIHNQETNYRLNLGATDGTGRQTRYFSNLGTSGKMEDIVVEITISNTSAGTTSPFNILANVDFANCVSPVEALKDKIVVDCDKSGAVLETTAGKTQTTFTFKISLKQNTDGTYGDTALTSPSANNVQLQMNLEQTTTCTQSQLKTEDVAVKVFTATEVSTINTGLSVSESYATKFPYYVEMGERDNNGKVKWLIIGVSGADGLTALTDQDTTAFGKGLMLNKTYVMLSEKVLYTESIDNKEISFQNNYNGNASPYLNNSEYSAQDYATSNVRNYLKGAENVYRGYKSDTKYEPDTTGKKINLLSDYNLTNDTMYAKIQGRTLTSLYNNIGTFNSSAKKWSSDYSGADENIKGTTSDKLWLLSESEVTDLLGTTKALRKTSTYGGTASSAAAWWLRSPYSSYACIVRYVYDGYLDNSLADDTASGVRAAFLF